MAYEIPGLTLGTLLADTDLSVTGQFRGVVINPATDRVTTASVAGAAIVGVLQDNPKAGRAASLMTKGITKAVAGATVAAGDALSVDAQGRFITATGTDNIAGTALEAASAVGAIIAVDLA